MGEDQKERMEVKEQVLRDIIEKGESLTERVANFYNLGWSSWMTRTGRGYIFRLGPEDRDKYGEYPNEVIGILELLGSDKFDTDKLEYQKLRKDILLWQKPSRQITKGVLTLGGLLASMAGPFIYSEFLGQPEYPLPVFVVLPSMVPGFVTFCFGIWYTIFNPAPRNSDCSSKELVKLCLKAEQMESLNIKELRQRVYGSERK